MDKWRFSYLIELKTLWEKGEIACYEVNPLPDDKILDRYKLEQIADNILKSI